MNSSGALAGRLFSAWTEMRENPGRSALQAIGVIVGVASVLGGFSISDSQRKQAEALFVRVGGLDKLNVQPNAIVKEGTPSALQMANLGLRSRDATEGSALDSKAVNGVSLQRFANARVRSSFADQDRRVTGIGGDYLALNGYEIQQGRDFSTHDLDTAAPVAILGAEAANVFFPTGNIVGQGLRVGEISVTIVGVFREKVFRFRKDQNNIFAWRNKIVALPATLVAQRMQGDAYHRLDRVTFRIPDLKSISMFSRSLTSLLKANHRLQKDFRLDDVAARIKKQQEQGDIYNIIFMLSGVLALLGGGIVNVNIQLASLKERVREVGVKMAIGAPGKEIFKEFMTEAVLLTFVGSVAGILAGIAFSKIITVSLGIPLWMRGSSFFWALLLAAVFGMIFALYPAFKASRLSPMEALHYE